ncbi:hypothetical protein Scep_007270 [Stephania cephalantha]|uniref:Uncharacterized protein n=1 Tax=Stephania cephalantha TaxID=152367 RepID=A0AAP0K9G4_9MAGN
MPIYVKDVPCVSRSAHSSWRIAPRAYMRGEIEDVYEMSCVVLIYIYLGGTEASLIDAPCYLALLIDGCLQSCIFMRSLFLSFYLHEFDCFGYRELLFWIL